MDETHMDETHEEEPPGSDAEDEGIDFSPDDHRGPPPEFTGAEAAYLFRNKEERTPMVVRLSDGELVRGVIEYYDRDMVKINRTEGPNLFIRKTQIRYMHREG
jgi:small nuclear ribonucleoprotein (snRNP)-like protein